MYIEMMISFCNGAAFVFCANTFRLEEGFAIGGAFIHPYNHDSNGDILFEDELHVIFEDTHEN